MTLAPAYARCHNPDCPYLGTPRRVVPISLGEGLYTPHNMVWCVCGWQPEVGAGDEPFRP